MTTESSHNVKIRGVFWDMFWRSALLGVVGGIALGAGYGVCVIAVFALEPLGRLVTKGAAYAPDAESLVGFVLFSFLAAVVGFVLGTFPGLFLGILNGVLLGAITNTWFMPLIDPRVYRRTVTSIGSAATTLVVMACWLVMYLQGEWAVFLLWAGLPSVIAIIWSYFASRRLAMWYIDVATFETHEDDVETTYKAGS